MYSTGSGDHLTISIFSFFNSPTIVCILEPLGPIHAPTESTSGSFDQTAILVLKPASLAIDLISTIPSSISGTSSSNSSLTISE